MGQMVVDCGIQYSWDISYIVLMGYFNLHYITIELG